MKNIQTTNQRKKPVKYEYEGKHWHYGDTIDLTKSGEPNK